MHFLSIFITYLMESLYEKVSFTNGAKIVSASVSVPTLHIIIIIYLFNVGKKKYSLEFYQK